MSPSRLRWRWEERDFGFRFRAGTGPNAVEHYQAAASGAYYVVPASQRKLSKTRAAALAKLAKLPTAPGTGSPGPTAYCSTTPGVWNPRSSCDGKTKAWPESTSSR